VHLGYSFQFLLYIGDFRLPQVLTLLINLCMHTLPNRAALMQAAAPAEYVADNPPAQGSVSALQALLEYFYKCEELAR